MKFEYEITESTTQTELVNAAGQSNVTCSRLFADLVNSLPKHQAILKLTVSDTLPVDKLAFILDGDSEIDSVTIILR